MSESKPISSGTRSKTALIDESGDGEKISRKTSSFPSGWDIKIAIIETGLKCKLGMANSLEAAEMLLDEITSLYDELVELHRNYMQALYAYLELTEFEGIAKRMFKTEHDYLNTITVIKKRVKSLERNNSPVDASTGSSHHNQPAFLPFRVPEVKIKPFSDNLSNPFEFCRFKSDFSNFLSLCPEMKDNYKLFLLKSNLTGKALSLIERIEASDDHKSYDIAWDTLEKEFLDLESLINKSVDEILDLSQVKTVEEVLAFATALRFKLIELERFGVKMGDSKSLWVYAQ